MTSRTLELKVSNLQEIKEEILTAHILYNLAVEYYSDFLRGLIKSECEIKRNLADEILDANFADNQRKIEELNKKLELCDNNNEIKKIKNKIKNITKKSTSESEVSHQARSIFGPLTNPESRGCGVDAKIHPNNKKIRNKIEHEIYLAADNNRHLSKEVSDLLRNGNPGSPPGKLGNKGTKLKTKNNCLKRAKETYPINEDDYSCIKKYIDKYGRLPLFTKIVNYIPSYAEFELACFINACVAIAANETTKKKRIDENIERQEKAEQIKNETEPNVWQLLCELQEFYGKITKRSVSDLVKKLKDEERYSKFKLLTKDNLDKMVDYNNLQPYKIPKYTKPNFLSNRVNPNCSNSSGGVFKVISSKNKESELYSIVSDEKDRLKSSKIKISLPYASNKNFSDKIVNICSNGHKSLISKNGDFYYKDVKILAIKGIRLVINETKPFSRNLPNILNNKNLFNEIKQYIKSCKDNYFCVYLKCVCEFEQFNIKQKKENVNKTCGVDFGQSNLGGLSIVNSNCEVLDSQVLVQDLNPLYDVFNNLLNTGFGLMKTQRDMRTSIVEGTIFPDVNLKKVIKSIPRAIKFQNKTKKQRKNNSFNFKRKKIKSENKTTVIFCGTSKNRNVKLSQCIDNLKNNVNALNNAIENGKSKITIFKLYDKVLQSFYLMLKICWSSIYNINDNNNGLLVNNGESYQRRDALDRYVKFIKKFICRSQIDKNGCFYNAKRFQNHGDYKKLQQKLTNLTDNLAKKQSAEYIRYARYHDADVIALENINKTPSTNRKSNKRMQSFRSAKMAEQIKAKSELTDIMVYEVNPPYTSQVHYENYQVGARYYKQGKNFVKKTNQNKRLGDRFVTINKNDDIIDISSEKNAAIVIAKVANNPLKDRVYFYAEYKGTDKDNNHYYKIKSGDCVYTQDYKTYSISSLKSYKNLEKNKKIKQNVQIFKDMNEIIVDKEKYLSIEVFRDFIDQKLKEKNLLKDTSKIR